jgi:putative flippase GtrA
MAMTPTMVLDRLTGGRGQKAARYSAVSVVTVAVTECALVLLHGVFGVGPALANLIAVSISTVPGFVLNKRWVWGKNGPAHVRREVLPFWGFTLLGLGLSSGLVVIAHRITDGSVVLVLANLLGFGIVWVAKFLFLDQLIFGAPGREVVA